MAARSGVGAGASRVQNSGPFRRLNPRRVTPAGDDRGRALVQADGAALWLLPNQHDWNHLPR